MCPVCGFLAAVCNVLRGVAFHTRRRVAPTRYDMTRPMPRIAVLLLLAGTAPTAAGVASTALHEALTRSSSSAFLSTTPMTASFKPFRRIGKALTKTVQIPRRTRRVVARIG